MSSRAQLLVVGLHALLGLSVLLSATVLAGLHTQISAPLWGLYGTVLGLAGAGSAALAAVGASTNGRASIPQPTLDALQQTLQDSIDHLANARHTIDSTTVVGGRRASDPTPPAPPAPPQL